MTHDMDILIKAEDIKEIKGNILGESTFIILADHIHWVKTASNYLKELKNNRS